MAGRSRKKQSDTVTPNAIVASAVRMRPGRVQRNTFNQDVSWHREGWRYFDTVGEYRFAVTWVGNMVSRAKLRPAKRQSDGSYQILEGGRGGSDADRYARQIVEDFVGDSEAEKLSRLGVNLTVAGEANLMGWVRDGRDFWEVASTDEVNHDGTRYKIIGEGLRERLNDADVGEPQTAVRVWRKHPRDSRFSDSPTRAALPILSEIDKLTQHVSAQANSRLAGAGVFAIPQELEFPMDDDGDSGHVAFRKIMQNAMQEPIHDREHPSALVPIIVAAPGDMLEKFQHITFWSPFDEHSMALRQEGIRRLSLSMDMPPEIMTGVSETNHWNAWAIDEAAIKAHTLPVLELVTTSLTEGIMYPSMRDQFGGRVASEYAFVADTSQLRLRPNRAREAQELYDRGVLKPSALLRETGFDEDDQLKGEDLQRFLLMKVASGSNTPEQVDAALEALGVDLSVAGEQLREARPAPSLRERPIEGPPDFPDDPANASLDVLVAACEGMVYRALERAGNRLKGRKGIKTQVMFRSTEAHINVAFDADDVDYMMTDAWTTVDEMCEGRGIRASALTRVLDAYTRHIITERSEVDRDLLRRYLRESYRELVS